MSTVTREQKKQILIDTANHVINRDNTSPHSENLRELARIALASLEAEPVGEVVLGEYDDCGCHPDAKVVCIAADGQADWENFKDGTRLYTAPPAPVSVPEPIKRNDADGWWMYKGRRVGGGCAEWYNLALDDCRAAMLQGADGNSPVFPDGWKLVPVELTGAMTNAMTDAILDDLHNVDVWRSVLAAAPQQEVK
ncbi:TPA: hypothetical protein LTW92_001986 [Enterobacter cloacae]|nr:hypothetical protein [Enterobacter cloacae]